MRQDASPTKMPPNIPTKSQSGKIVSMDISEHPVVWRWMMELAKHDQRGFYSLTHPSRVTLCRIFGKPDKKNKDVYMWFIKEAGMTWQISHHPELGLEFRIVLESNLPTPLSESIIFGTGMVQYLTSLLKVFSI
jgi:hypothetical protein